MLIALLSNLLDVSKAKALSSQLLEVEPESESAILESIDPFTMVINNDAVVVDQANQALSLSDGFVSNNTPVDTKITMREEPLPDNSSDTVYYVVRNGDTLTALGWKFGVKLATLQYLNDIDNANALRPGVRLKVPPKGYEVSSSLIAQKEKDKAAKLAASTRSTVSRSTTSSRTYNGSYTNYGGISFIVPINHNGISRGLGNGHTGIDYRASIGTPVMAAADGVVAQISTGWSGGYGNEIVVNHGSGVASRYAHLSKIIVQPGQTVSQGQVIGYSGNTGRSTGPHLHFEKMINGRFVYPF